MALIVLKIVHAKMGQLVQTVMAHAHVHQVGKGGIVQNGLVPMAHGVKIVRKLVLVILPIPKCEYYDLIFLWMGASI